MDAAVFRGGVHVTVAYFAVFFAAVVLQAYYKLSFKALAKKKVTR